MKPPNLNINVVVMRSSDDANWFAKMGKNAEGEKAIVFFQRPGKQSLLQKVKDGLTGVYSGNQAAKQYLQEFSAKDSKIKNLNLHIKELEQKAGNPNTLLHPTEFNNKSGNVEISATTKLTFQHTPALMKQKLADAIFESYGSSLDPNSKSSIRNHIDLAVEISTNKDFASVVKPDPGVLENAAYELIIYAKSLNAQPELQTDLRKMITAMQTTASTLKREA